MPTDCVGMFPPPTNASIGKTRLPVFIARYPTRRCRGPH
jgi:hypothetical protein